MAPENFKRKLTAILSADVKGYSRLMGEDEEGTIRTLKVYLEVLTGFIQQHQGRIVATGGDSVLAEFSSVVDAVRCAVDIQKELQERNKTAAEDRRLEFRIGVNLGDVVEEGDTILGDGVNIAARLESLSEAGGICLSGTAFDQVKNKLNLGYRYLGEQTVKNILEPVRVYQVLMEPGAAGKVITDEKVKPIQWRKVALLLGVVLIMGIGAVAVGRFYLRPASHTAEVTSREKMAFSLPDKPSIAVLPFKNLGGSPEQEVLADGITESVIGAISRVSELFVIASNSVFTYKGKPVRIQTVSRELGVRNVLEGTVQVAGDRLRVHAQLIDATTGRHLLSEKYDRPMKDVFSVQDDISMKILTALRVKLVGGEQERVWARGTNNLEAYLKFLQAYSQFRSLTKNNMILTRQLCEEAIGLDPKYQASYLLLGTTHMIDLWFKWGESPRVSMEKAISIIQKAVTLDPNSDWAHAALGHLYLLQRRHDEAVKEGEKAIALNPNGDNNMAILGMTFNFVGRNEEAIALFKEAQRRNPYCPAWYYNGTVSYNLLGRWDEAIAEGQRALERYPDHIPALFGLAVAYGNSDRLTEGRAIAVKLLKLNPRLSLATFAMDAPYKNPSNAEIIKAGLRKVGIPENPSTK